MDYNKWERILQVRFSEYTPGSATPKDGTDGEFFVAFNNDYATVYRKRKKAPAKKKSKAELEREAEIKRRESVLAELTETAYNLRRDFVNELTVPKADYTKLMRHAGRALVASNINYWGVDFAKTFAGLIGAEVPKGYVLSELCGRLLDKTAEYAAPDKPIIAAIYAAYGDKKDKGYWRKQWNGMPEYSACYALDYLYDFLCDFGYEMSDAEMVLKDGTHPLLLKEKQEVPQEADAAKKAASNVSNIESGLPPP